MTVHYLPRRPPSLWEQLVSSVVAYLACLGLIVVGIAAWTGLDAVLGWVR